MRFLSRWLWCPICGDVIVQEDYRHYRHRDKEYTGVMWVVTTKNGHKIEVPLSLLKDCIETIEDKDERIRLKKTLHIR